MRFTLKFPAGTLDRVDEQPVDCMVRELAEETGITLLPSDLHVIAQYVPMPGFSKSLMYMYLACIPSDIQFEPLEDEDVWSIRWVGLGELGERIAQNNILDVKTIMAYYILRGSQPCDWSTI